MKQEEKEIKRGSPAQLYHSVAIRNSKNRPSSSPKNTYKPALVRHSVLYTYGLPLPTFLLPTAIALPLTFRICSSKKAINYSSKELEKRTITSPKNTCKPAMVGHPIFYTYALPIPTFPLSTAIALPLTFRTCSSTKAINYSSKEFEKRTIPSPKNTCKPALVRHSALYTYALPVPTFPLSANTTNQSKSLNFQAQPTPLANPNFQPMVTKL